MPAQDIFHNEVRHALEKERVVERYQMKLLVYDHEDEVIVT